MYRAEMLRLADSAVELNDTHLSPEHALHEAGRRMLDYLTSDFALAMYRICVAETPRFPEIGRAFYEGREPEIEGRGLFSVAYTAPPRKTEARGVLRVDDIDLAADQFFQLCQTTICDRMICGVQYTFTEAEIEHVLAGAVATFMARYGVKPSKVMLSATCRAWASCAVSRIVQHNTGMPWAFSAATGAMSSSCHSCEMKLAPVAATAFQGRKFRQAVMGHARPILWRKSTGYQPARDVGREPRHGRHAVRVEGHDRDRTLIAPQRGGGVGFQPPIDGAKGAALVLHLYQ